MALTPDQIVEEARRLTPEGLAEVIDKLLWALHGGQTADEVQAWSEVVTRRLKEIDEGKVQGMPAETSLNDLRQPLDR